MIQLLFLFDVPYIHPDRGVRPAVVVYSTPVHLPVSTVPWTATHASLSHRRHR
jgi:hypothetical protein